MLPVIAALVISAILPRISVAGMNRMSDTELAGVVGQGFSSFTMANGVALADFTGISVSTYTEIDSLKMGYWDKTGDGNKAWDQNWTSVKLGTSTKDLQINGFFMKAEFDPTTINDPANRQLKSFTIGSRDVTGIVSADFQSFTGIISGPAISRTNLGTASYQLNHTDLSFTIDVAGANKGVWINMGTATRL